jgi:hypothetical protein
MVCAAYKLYATAQCRQQAVGERVVTVQTPIENRMEAFRARWDGKVGKMLIGGEWREAASGETFATEDPSTGREAGRRGERGQADVDAGGRRRRAGRSRARGAR